VLREREPLAQLMDFYYILARRPEVLPKGDAR
jgi:hypothetical protein